MKEMLLLGFFLVNGALVMGSPSEGVGNPENITVQVIDSKTVEVSWSTTWKNVERYDVTYNPTENRVVSQAAGNSHSIILKDLRPNTQYQVTVTAVVNGKNYRSRRLVFRTSADPNDTLDLEDEIRPVPTRPTKLRKTYPVTPEVINPDPTAIGSKYTPQTSTTVRGVEIGLVLLALVVWIIAIALFFHRWGKIRMLLPYQPDYKTQQSLKVPGTGTTIVSGCTGNSATQGQQEGPGCVQHLRWSSRYFDEPSTAKRTSPGRWALKPRVSSAVFPASPPFFYSRTSADCESPRVIRHGAPRAESIPLCQVTQPRSEGPEDIISIAVPAIASEVNEKPRSRKPGDPKVVELNKSPADGSEFPKKDKIYLDESYYPQTFYQKSSEQPPEPVFMVESADSCFHDPSAKDEDKEKPRRYNRSSLKKQKFRLCEDFFPAKNVPIHESESEEQEKSRKNAKTAEMKRKTFLRKISLQDTYLNYNQDYWLDFKKSLRFHKSIDLGHLGEEEAGGRRGEGRPGGENQEPGSVWEEPFVHQAPDAAGDLRKSDSDPIIFPCERCSRSEEDAGEDGAGKASSWFLFPSDENIPLFAERNGLIETDFEAFDEDCAPLDVFYAGGTRSLDLADFHEVRLSGSSENLTRFNFHGGDAFFGNLGSTSGESDVFLIETEPVRASDDRKGEFSPYIRPSSSPPKSTPH